MSHETRNSQFCANIFHHSAILLHKVPIKLISSQDKSPTGQCKYSTSWRAYSEFNCTTTHYIWVTYNWSVVGLEIWSAFVSCWTRGRSGRARISLASLATVELWSKVSFLFETEGEGRGSSGKTAKINQLLMNDCYINKQLKRLELNKLSKHKITVHARIFRKIKIQLEVVNNQPEQQLIKARVYTSV